MIELRPYQQRGKDLIRQAFARGSKRLLVVAPPGAGKGTMIAEQAVSASIRGKKTLVYMHKRELVMQQGARIAKQFNFYDVGYYLSGTKQKTKPIMIGSVQTMVNRKLGDFDLVILDEAHRVKTGQHQIIHQKYKDSFVVAYTATPFRGDKKGFTEDFDEIIQFTTYNELVQLKALVPTKVIAPKLAPNVDGVHIRQGEYVDQELYKLYNEERIYRAVVEKWIEYANDKKTIIFNVNNKGHSRQTAEWFRTYGIDARSIDCDTPKKERDKLLKDFENNKFKVLCNIALFTEGVSIDDTECIIFNVATKVLTKWVQASARGSRPVFDETGKDWAKGPDGNYKKPHCLIIDFGHNCERHGFVDDYDQVPFDLSGKPKRKNKEQVTKSCPACDLMVSVQTRTCPGCGHTFAVVNKENKVFADEVEWGEVDRALKLVEKFQTMSYNVIEKTPPGPHLLRIVGLVRNYKPSWAAFQAYKAGYVQINPAGDTAAINQINQFLQAREIDSGYHDIYLLIKEKFGA